MRALFVSLPTTLIMNIPYGIVMVATNESLKKVLNPSNEQNLSAFLVAGAGAGAVVRGFLGAPPPHHSQTDKVSRLCMTHTTLSQAAAATCPFDVAKSKLQTQGLLNVSQA